jgi:hypothetical protein
LFYTLILFLLLVFEEASVHAVVEKVLQAHLAITSSRLCCPSQHIVDRSEVTVKSGLITAGTEGVTSVQEWVDTSEQRSGANCHACGTSLVSIYWFVHNPFLLAFDVSATNITI